MGRFSRICLAFIFTAMGFCFANPVVDVNYNAGFLVVGESGLFDATSLFSIFSTAFDTRTPSTEQQQLHLERYTQETQLDAMAKQHNGIISGEILDPLDVETSIHPVTLAYPALVNWFELTSEVDNSIVSDYPWDPLLIRHVVFAHQLDVLCILRISKLDTFDRLQLFMANMGNTEHMESVFDRIISGKDVDQVFGTLTAAMASWWMGKPMGVVNFRTSLPSTRFVLDGRPVENSSTTLLVVPGEHEIGVSAPGYHDQHFVVTTAANEALTIEPKLESKPNKPLLVTSNRSEAVFSVLGSDIRKTLPWIWESKDALFAYEFSSGSGETYTGQAAHDIDQLHLMIPNSPLSDAWFVDASQNKFYQSLGRALISTGIAVASSGILGSMVENGLDPAVLHIATTATTGLIAVNVLGMLRQLFAYYTKTQYSSL